MSTTITAQPPKLILAKQPVGFTAHTTDAGSPIRIKANVVGNTDADSMAVDGSGNASFELSDYLQGLFSITDRYNKINAPATYPYTPLQKQFNFESFAGTPPASGSSVLSDTHYLLDGYVPHSRRKALYAQYSSLQAYLAANLNFLSWWPANEPKKIIPGQKEFINFFQLTSETPLNLKVAVFFFCNNGLVDSWGQVFTLTGVKKYDLVYIPCGLEQLGLHLPLGVETTPDVYVTDYQVYVYDPNVGVGTFYHKFSVDRSYHDNIRQLYIRNPFGLLEILLCTGEKEQTNSLKIEMVRTNGRILPDKLNWKIEKNDTVKVNTGFLTKGQMQWLSDMDFTEAYELQGTVMHPIVFKDMDLPVLHDNIFQYTAELTYEYAYNETTEVG